MTSNFIFSCCHNPIKEESSASINNHLSRNVIAKNKTCISINSPKASLKSLATLRSPKNNNILSSSTNAHMVSTTDFLHVERQKKINFLQLPPEKNIKFTKVNTSSDIIRSLSPTHIPIPVLKAPKQNIRFTYKNAMNPQLTERTIRMPQKVIQMQRKTVVKNIGRRKEDGKREEKIKENIMNQESGQKVENIVKKQEEGVGVSKKFKLGGSKFTIQSEGQESFLQDIQLKMQQSAIVVNLFNPSLAQPSKWQQSQMKLKGSDFSFSKPRPGQQIYK